jgi:hypothetical protein
LKGPHGKLEEAELVEEKVAAAVVERYSLLVVQGQEEEAQRRAGQFDKGCYELAEQWAY